jgi:hypothetical protein
VKKFPKSPKNFQSEPPDGIILTFPKMFFEDRGMSASEFEKLFERQMRPDGSYWNFKLTNLPKHEVLYVYLVFDGFIQFRCNLVGYERNVSKSFKDSPDQQVREFPNCNWVIFTGPVVRPTEDFPKQGFQGFRYTHKIF